VSERPPVTEGASVRGPAPVRGRRPSKADLQAAYDTTIPDLIPDGELHVLLVGINPSLWSGWAATHFARPGNRLWRTLHEAGLTPRLLRPDETAAITAAGIGITNLVARATARADELTDAELRAGRADLERTVARTRPRVVAFLGLSSYRIAYSEPRATVGRQQRTIAGARVWLLPNPSGLNAHYQQPALSAAYAELRAYLDSLPA
jgi:TDG/mug DNA glycosylase family protein